MNLVGSNFVLKICLWFESFGVTQASWLLTSAIKRGFDTWAINHKKIYFEGY